LETDVKRVKAQLSSGKDSMGRPLSSELELALNNQLAALNSEIAELRKKENLLLAKQQPARPDAKSGGQYDARPSH
jgi:hypothetical protein